MLITGWRLHMMHRMFMSLDKETEIYRFLLARSVRTQLRTAWIMTTRMTRRTRSLLMLELLSLSLAWYRHTSRLWLSFPIRSLISFCSSTRGLRASVMLAEAEEEEDLGSLASRPAPQLLVSLSWERCFLFSISLRLFCRLLMLDTRSFGGWKDFNLDPDTNLPRISVGDEYCKEINIFRKK